MLHYKEFSERYKRTLEERAAWRRLPWSERDSYAVPNPVSAALVSLTGHHVDMCECALWRVNAAVVELPGGAFAIGLEDLPAVLSALGDVLLEDLYEPYPVQEEGCFEDDAEWLDAPLQRPEDDAPQAGRACVTIWLN